MARLRAHLALAIAVTATSGCAVEWTREHTLYCRMDEKLAIRDTLYFGRAIPGGGTVGDADWSRFESDVIAHAFPQGFTVLDARGSWRGNDGATVSEPSRAVVIVHEDDAASDAAIRDIVQRYRSEFRQEAVLRERSAACLSL
ncbi:MAG TPA: DUF3574 domain-containing protein [Rhodanobacteraceae bacterium]|nr:DUF3574 domain-containing protein [Rhodanobacteraceae bacterium]